jgi:hypothetical protein
MVGLQRDAYDFGGGVNSRRHRFGGLVVNLLTLPIVPGKGNGDILLSKEHFGRQRRSNPFCHFIT